VAGWWRGTVPGIVLALVTWGIGSMAGWGQLPLPGSQTEAPNPLTDSTATPGKALLYNLEAELQKTVAERGGAGFASWFADDGVVLGNGKAPVVGKVAIEKSANWTTNYYQLTWTPDGAWMNAAGDSGYTWGQYEGQGKDANGNPVKVSGRYITVWGKQADGSWKVELEASANEPPDAGECCRLPDK
jgi:ketosteroid isomerase-like protein